jgi:hypothetical protein
MNHPFMLRANTKVPISRDSVAVFVLWQVSWPKLAILLENPQLLVSTGIFGGGETVFLGEEPINFLFARIT